MPVIILCTLPSCTCMHCSAIVLMSRVRVKPLVTGINARYLFSVTEALHDNEFLLMDRGGGPRVVVSTAAFHARVWGSVPCLGDFKETKMFLPHPRVKVSIVGSLRDREVACSASDRQGSNFKSCVWRTVSSQTSHHPQEVLLAQFSLYVHKGGLKPDSFHFIPGYSRGQLPSIIWSTVYDAGPTLKQHWFNVSCLLGRPSTSEYSFAFCTLWQYRDR